MAFRIARAGLDDVETIVEHRRAMFWDMGQRNDVALDEMSGSFRGWVVRKIESGEYLAWFAIADDAKVAAGVGLWLMDWPPHLIGPGVPRGNIVNVYTRREHRRQGLAGVLVKTALDCCREIGLKSVVLHASPEGKSLYESMGFRATNEMRLLL